MYLGPIKGVQLRFPAVKAEAGHKWDLKIEAAFRVVDPVKFLQQHAISRVFPNRPLTSRELANLLVDVVRDQVVPEVERLTVAELKDEQRLSAGWWGTKLKDWLQRRELGIEIEGQVSALEWSSASAAAAELARREREALQEAGRRQEEQRRLERDQQKLNQEHAASLKQIETNSALSQLERRRQTELLEQQHRADLLAAGERARELERQAERNVLEHNLMMKKLERQIAEESRIARQQESRWQTDSELKRLEHERAERLAKNRLDAIEAEIKSLEEERDLVSQQSAHGAGPDFLARILREKLRADGEPVLLVMREIVTRDIGDRRVETIKINGSLAFTLRSQRAGYVTLLNIGTSGATHVLTPNSARDAARATISAGGLYSVPGGELLPIEILPQRELFEGGPPGWEVIVAIVSQQPLMTPTVRDAAKIVGPFFTLHNWQVDDLIKHLASLNPEHWTAGGVEFLVEAQATPAYRW